MHKAEVAAERLIQFEKDKAAFERLSPRRQRIAGRIAKAGFWMREAVAHADKTIPSAIDSVFYGFFHLPWVAAKKTVSATANSFVYGLKLGIGLGTGTLDKAISLSGSGEKRNKFRKSLAAWKEKATKAIDVSWRNTRKVLSAGAMKATQLVEYYVAVGLYRATKWILDPRTPKGKPLFGNEKLNKIIGTAAAVAIFAAVAYEFAKIEALSKIWHVQYAHAGMKAVETGKTPLYTELLKQAIFQPAVMVGVTVVKFFALPVLAASRNTFKLSRTAQGVAYKYNERLQAHELKTAGQPQAGRRRRYEAIRKTVEHIVEKSSPEFYKARFKAYKQGVKNGQITPPSQPSVPSAPEAAGKIAKLELAPSFKKSGKSVQKTAKAKPAPAKTAEKKSTTQRQVM
jgi:hypothetical protein